MVGKPPRHAVPIFHLKFGGFRSSSESHRNVNSRRVKSSILLFTSLFTIPLARQSCLDAALFARFQVVGVTLDFLDDVLRLNFPLKPAQRIFQRFAFLNTDLSQNLPPPNLPLWLL